MRGLGAVAAFRALPDAVAVPFAFLTLLGGQWLLFFLLAVLYWLGDRAGVGIDRRRAAFVLALGLAGLVLTVGLKALFALPRPPDADRAVGAALVPASVRPFYAFAATADGYGFPSGHALGSTVVWGGLALATERGTRRRRFLGAGAIIALVGLSRVAIGVHYLVDVLAGVAIGVVVLAAATRAGFRDEPGGLFWLGGVFALVGVVVTGFASDPIAALGASVGAAVAWHAVGDTVAVGPRSRRQALATVAGGLPTVGGAFVAVSTLDPPAPITLIAHAAVLGGLVVLPLVVERLVGED